MSNPAADRSQTQSTERRKILVIEDERDIRELVRVNLEAEGFAVLEAADGELGLALVKQACEASGWQVSAGNGAGGGGELTVDFGLACRLHH